jgi:hypothetical protein
VQPPVAIDEGFLTRLWGTREGMTPSRKALKNLQPGPGLKSEFLWAYPARCQCETLDTSRQLEKEAPAALIRGARGGSWSHPLRSRSLASAAWSEEPPASRQMGTYGCHRMPGPRALCAHSGHLATALLVPARGASKLARRNRCSIRPPSLGGLPFDPLLRRQGLAKGIGFYIVATPCPSSLRDPGPSVSRSSRLLRI